MARRWQGMVKKKKEKERLQRNTQVPPKVQQSTAHQAKLNYSQTIYFNYAQIWNILRENCNTLKD